MCGHCPPEPLDDVDEVAGYDGTDAEADRRALAREDELQTLGGDLHVGALIVSHVQEPGTTTCRRCRAPFVPGDEVAQRMVVDAVSPPYEIRLSYPLLEHVACPTATTDTTGAGR